MEHQKPEEITKHLKDMGYALYAADSEGEKTYTQVNWTQPSAILLGQEGGGLSKEWKAEVISIPMQKPVESLNVGAAAAVLLYESYRQRHA